MSWCTRKVWIITALVFINVYLVFLVALSEQNPVYKIVSFSSLISTKPKTTAVSLPSKTPPAASPLSSIFYRSVFITSSGTNVRLLSVRQCRNKRNETLQIGGVTINLRSAPLLGCPWFFAPKCDYVGYLSSGSAKTLLSQQNLPQSATINIPGGPSLTVPLIDSRTRTSKRNHQLAVCLQPIYLMANWSLLPLFFENWIAHGATLFLIYVQTVTEELASMLQIYVDDGRDNGYKVEIVPWSPFPDSKHEKYAKHNANNEAYRTEVASGVNDCLMRARGQSKYVVSSDLDEILSPMNANNTLISLLEKYSKVKSKKKQLPAAFVFLNSFAYVETDWQTITHPSAINFTNFDSVRLEKKVWGPGTRSKVIMIPELVHRTHVHSVLGFEDNSKYYDIAIPASVARVFHFRQVWTTNRTKESIWESRTLGRYVDTWNTNWNNRISRTLIREQAHTAEFNMSSLQLEGRRRYTLNDPTWPNRGIAVLDEIENCRVGFDKYKSSECKTQWLCRAQMKSVNDSEWIEAVNSWVVG